MQTPNNQRLQIPSTFIGIMIRNSKHLVINTDINEMSPGPLWALSKHRRVPANYHITSFICKRNTNTSPNPPSFTQSKGPETSHSVLCFLWASPHMATDFDRSPLMYQLECLFWNIVEQKLFHCNKQTLIFKMLNWKKPLAKVHLGPVDTLSHTNF